MTIFLKSAAALALLLAVPVAASAGTVWKINGIFDDGTSLTGQFTLNVYGFLSEAKLATQANGGFAGAIYGRPGDSFGQSSNGINISQNAYQDELNLILASDITTAKSTVALLSTSYECRGSGYCFVPSGGIIRHIVSGVATIPEPASWTLMIAGFVLAGGVLRRQRVAAAPNSATA